MAENLSRRPLAGHCLDIDGMTWHNNGKACHHCGFGIDEDPERSGKGFYGEPLAPIEKVGTNEQGQ